MKNNILEKHPLPWHFKHKDLPVAKWTYYRTLEIYDKDGVIVYDCNLENSKKVIELIDILNYLNRNTEKYE